MNTNSKTIPLKEKVGYALGDTAFNIIFQFVSSFSLVFFTDVALVPVGIITGLLAIARIWDAVNDPLMGMITDRLNLKWGKYRSYFLFFPIPLALAFILLFIAPSGGDMWRLIYCFLGYNILMMIYTAINVPYGALITTMTDDETQRVSFSSIRTFGAVLGGLLVTSTATFLIEKLGNGNQAKGYGLTALIYGIVVIALLYVLFFTVKERVVRPPVKKEGLGKAIWTVVKNPVWLIYFFMVFFVFANMFTRISATAQFFIYAVGNPGLIGIFFTFVTLVQLPGALFANIMSKYMPRKTIMLLCGFISILTQVASFFFIPSIIVFIVLQCIGGIAITVIIPLLSATIGDVADFFEEKHGINAAGVTSSSMTLSNQFSLAIAGAVVGLLLSLAGYVPNEAQNPAVIHVLKASMSYIPAIFSAIFMGLVVIFPLKFDFVKRTKNQEAK